MTYKMEYEDGSAQQVDGPALEPKESIGGRVGKTEGHFKSLRMPSVLKTGATFLIAGGLFFGAEIILPENFKPSTIVGTYEARLHAQMKAAELQQQSRLTAYEAALKVAYDQNNEQYRAKVQAMSGYYQASYDRAKVFASATAQIQQQYVGYRLQKTRAEQSGDIGVISMARLFGRLGNEFAPGSGDGMMEYAAATSDELNAELDRAALDGKTINVDGWDTDLPSPYELQSQLEQIKPVPLPALPNIWEDAPRQDFTSSHEAH